MHSILLVFVVSFPFAAYYVNGSDCLKALTGQKCSDIQTAGQKISNSIRASNALFEEVVLRCIEEAHLIIESSMKYVKQEVSNVKFDYAGKSM